MRSKMDVSVESCLATTVRICHPVGVGSPPGTACVNESTGKGFKSKTVDRKTFRKDLESAIKVVLLPILVVQEK
jgi:hypothetical protein